MAQFKERIIISIVGPTNVGKSTLFNIITGQENKAIVDSRAGTTADNVVSLMEMHGLGMVKLIDTAGIDEDSSLGDKKRQKTKQTAIESDLVLFVLKNTTKKITHYEIEMLNLLKQKNKKVLVIYNNFNKENKDLKIDYNSIDINLEDKNKINLQTKIIEFIINNYETVKNNVDLFSNFDLNNSYVLLIIPIDEESPESRILRPQSMVVEKLLNKFIAPVLYRPNLENFDKDDFIQKINDLKNTKEGLSLIITDSQAINKIYNYIPKDVNFTSFSIIMSNFMSNGKINELVLNTGEIENLNDGDKILIVEACKHDKKCNDIATVQLPNIIRKYTNKNINFYFNFGQTFLSEDDLKERNYKMVIMCGGCMIDKQNYQARIELLNSLKVPITNYGLVFSYIEDKNMLERVVNFSKFKI